MTRETGSHRISDFCIGVWDSARKQDSKTVVLLVSVVLIQILSYYVTSRRFFRSSLAPLFPTQLTGLDEHVYWLVTDFMSQFLLPLLLIIFYFKEPVGNYGIAFGNRKLGLRIWLTFWAVMLPILWIVSSSDSFRQIYPHAQIVRTDWILFVLYEICVLLYMTGWEFIWRGYLLFGLKDRFGDTAVFIQMIPFVLLHFGKPVIETFGAVIGGLLLGYLALRTGSFWYGVMIHTSVMFSIDLLSTLRFRSGVFGINPGNVVEMIAKLVSGN